MLHCLLYRRLVKNVSTVLDDFNLMTGVHAYCNAKCQLACVLVLPPTRRGSAVAHMQRHRRL